jgi:hypothetical protein
MEKPPAELTEIASYLKTSDLRVKAGICKGKRIDFFKGIHTLTE